jgi:hypothetical protein
LLAYRASFSQGTIIQVTTNGYGRKVEGELSKLPSTVRIVNTRKRPEITPYFDTFNVAPIDLASYAYADFRNGCPITQGCGIGLSSSGFYPCAVAAGMDRILGWNLGRQSLPPAKDTMEDLLEKFCSHCGHFKRDHRRTDRPIMSASWLDAYARYRAQGTTLSP